MTTPVIEPAGTSEESGAGGLVGVPGALDRPGAPDVPGEVRLRLEIAYDGAGFCGWARQPGLRSVQGELESALRAVLRVEAGVPVRVAVAGRTDAGVHAVGQVCHSDVPASAWAASSGRHGGGHTSLSALAATTEPSPGVDLPAGIGPGPSLGEVPTARPSSARCRPPPTRPLRFAAA